MRTVGVSTDGHGRAAIAVWFTLAFQVARYVVLRADEQALVLPQEMLAQGAITDRHRRLAAVRQASYPAADLAYNRQCRFAL